MTGFFTGHGTGANPIPLARDDWITRLALLLQAGVVAWVLVIPGSWLLSRILPAQPQWPLAQFVGIAAILSLAMVCVITIVLGLIFPPAVARGIFRCVVLASPVLCRVGVVRLIGLVKDECRRGRAWVLVAILAAYLASAAVMAATPYPSLEQHDPRWVHEDLRDSPAFCRVAANFAERGQLVEDYYAADFSEGAYGYLPRMCVIPIAATASFFWLFGLTPHAFFLIHLLAGFLTVWLMAELSAGGGGGMRRLGIALCFLLVPVVWVPVTLGFPGTLLALAAITLLALHWTPPASGGRRTLWYAILPCLLLIRPEGVVLTAVVLGGTAVSKLIHIRSRFYRAATFLGVTLLLGLGGSAILNRLDCVARWSHLTCLTFDGNSGAFRPAHVPWWSLNEMYSTNQLSGIPLAIHGNPAFADELRAHPWAYAKFLCGMGVDALSQTLASAGLKSAWGTTTAFFLLCVAVLRRGHLPILILAIAFVVGVYLLNPMVGLRHLFCAIVVTIVLSARSVCAFANERFGRRESRALAPLMLCLAAFVIGFITLQVHGIRGHWKNHALVAVTERLAPLVGRDTVLAGVEPQLLACLTGARCIGGTKLVDCLDAAASRFQPEYIVLDDSPGRRAYSRYKEKGRQPAAYRELVHDEFHRFIILQRLPIPPAKAARAAVLGASGPGD